MPRAARTCLVALLVLSCWTASASAATYEWDEATGALTVTAASSDNGIGVRPSFLEPGTMSACGDDADYEVCGAWPDPSSVTIELTRESQDVGINIAALNARDGRHISVSIRGLNDSRVALYCSTKKTDPQTSCRISATARGLDLNSDGTEDVSFNGTRIDELEINTGDHADRIDLRRIQFPIRREKLERAAYAVLIDTGKGNDRILTGSTYDRVSGGPGNDYINTGAGNDSASGGIGNNTIISGPGDDILGYVGWGNDRINAGPGNDFIQAGNGRDRVIAGAGKDVVDHGRGPLWVNLGAGDDQLAHVRGPLTAFGGPGNDYFRVVPTYGAQRTARINCGPGYDRTSSAYPHRIGCEFAYRPYRP